MRPTLANVSLDVVSRKKATLPESGTVDAEHVTDFDPPLYNVWKQSEIQSLYLVHAYTTGHIP